MTRLVPGVVVALALVVSTPARAQASKADSAKPGPARARSVKARPVKADDTPSPLETLLTHLRLRRSLDDKNLLAKPADLAVTWPGNGVPTWAVDAALSGTACAVCSGHGVQLELAAGVAYHRDTELTSPKDLLAVGLTGELYLGNLADPVSHDLKLSLAYHRDGTALTQSLVAYLDYVPLGPLAIGRIWPRPTSGLLSVLAVEWAPTFSVEYGAALDAGAGQTVRLRVRAELRLYLAPRALREQVFLHASGELRETVGSSSFTEPAGHRSHLLTAGLTAYVDPKHHAAVSLEYREGVDPRTGQGPDRYLRLTLSLKL